MGICLLKYNKYADNEIHLNGESVFNYITYYECKSQKAGFEVYSLDYALMDLGIEKKNKEVILTNFVIDVSDNKLLDSYGTRAEDIPRQCVFAGTSNVINFLPLDRSGNRRFLPIMCDSSKAEVHILENEAESRAYIEQMWAEMMALYGDGKIRLKLPKEIEKNLIEYQRPFMQEDTWTGLIQEWLDHTSNQVVCVQQIYNEALKEIGKPRNSEAREIGQIMNGTVSGWKAYPNPRNIPGYGKQRGWMRVETKSGNSDETFVSVDATQMEIPFDIEK